MALSITGLFSGDTPVPLMEKVSAIVGIEIMEILSLSLLEVPHIRPQSLPTQLVLSSTTAISLSSSPGPAGLSSHRESFMDEDDNLELRVKVHTSASIFENKTLAKNLLEHILLPQNQAMVMISGRYLF